MPQYDGLEIRWRMYLVYTMVQICTLYRDLVNTIYAATMYMVSYLLFTQRG